MYFTPNVDYILTEDSLTCPDEKKIQFLDNASSIILFGVLLAINLSVVVGNWMVVSAIYISMKLRTITNLFIASLALSDLMVGITVLPFSAFLEVHKIWLFGENWCAVWLAMDVWMCTASIFNLCAISLDRYIAIAHPLTYPTLMSFLRAKLLVFGVWLLSFMVCFPPLVGWRDDRIPLDPETKLPPNFMPTRGPLNETIYNTTDISEFLSLTANTTIESLLRLYSSEFVDYLQQERTRRITNSTELPRIHIAIEKYKCPYSCELTNDTGYVLFSAFGSYYLPMSVMFFFYWRIYVAACRAQKSRRLGYLRATGNGLSNGTVITLRVHRGGQKNPHSDFLRKTGIDPPSKTCTEVQKNQSLKTKEDETTTRKASFTAEPLPSTSGEKTGSKSDTYKTGPANETEKADAQSVPQTNETEETPTKSGKTKWSFSARKDAYSVSYTKKPEEEEESSCVIEIPEPTQSASQPATPEPETSRQDEDDVTTDREEEDKRMPDEKRGNRFRKMMRMFNHRRFREQLRKFREEKKAATTLGIIVGVFALCWTPFFVIYVVRGICISCTNPTLFSVLFWLGYINSALNPFIYALTSEDYREAYQQILDNILCRNRPEDTIVMKKRKKEDGGFFSWIKGLCTKKQPHIQETRETVRLTAELDLTATSPPDISISTPETIFEPATATPKTTKTTMVTAGKSSVVTTAVPEIIPITTRSASLANVHSPETTATPPTTPTTIPETTVTATEPTTIVPKITKTILVTAAKSSVVTTTVPETVPITTRSTSLVTMRAPETTAVTTHISRPTPETSTSPHISIPIPDITAADMQATTAIRKAARRASLLTTILPKTPRRVSLFTSRTPEAAATHKKAVAAVLQPARSTSLFNMSTPETTTPERPITTTVTEPIRSTSLFTMRTPELVTTHTSVTTAVPEPRKSSSLFTMDTPQTTTPQKLNTTAVPEPKRSTSLHAMHTPETAKVHKKEIKTSLQPGRNVSIVSTCAPERTKIDTQATTVVTRTARNTSLLTIPETSLSSPHISITIPETMTTETQPTTTPGTSKNIRVTTRTAMLTTRSSSEDIPMDIVIEIPPDE